MRCCRDLRSRCEWERASAISTTRWRFTRRALKSSSRCDERLQDRCSLGANAAPYAEVFGSLLDQHSPPLQRARAAVAFGPAHKRRLLLAVGEVVAHRAAAHEARSDDGRVAFGACRGC